MNKISYLLGFAVVACALVAHVGCSGIPQTRPDETPEIRSDGEPKTGEVVEAVVDGVSVSAPIYQEGFVVSEERQAFENETIRQSLEALGPVIYGALENRFQLTLALRAASKVVPVILSRNSMFEEFQKDDSSPKGVPEYPEKMGNFIEEIYNSNSEEIIDNEEARKRVDILFAATRELVGKSKAGMYLDWAKCKIGDESMKDYIIPIVRYFRDHGYERGLSLFKAISSTLKEPPPPPAPPAPQASPKKRFWW